MSTMANAPPAIPEYDCTLFVNRDKEIELVTEKAQALSLEEPVRERTIIFWGYKGTGRTWLLKRLEEELSALGGVQAQYLDLNEWTGCAPAQAVQEVIGRIGDHARESLALPVANPDGEHTAAGDRSEELPTDVQTLLDNHVLVLLLDHVYESDWHLLAILEDQILALLAVHPRVLLVMAGRGRAYPWKTPELRLYTEEHHVEPFDQGLTQEQLQKQRPDAVPRVPEIHEMSYGYPLGNYLLAARPTVAQAMQETVEGLLDGVPAEERSWLEALCILRTFDEERIPVLLAVYLDDPSIQEWRYKQVRKARDRLLQTNVAQWEEKAGGWVVDEAIRPVLEKYLQETKPQVWRRLHCASYQLYKDWVQQYPEERYRWREEANHHAECLRDADHDPDQCL